MLSFYVDPSSGDDTGSGSQQSPWRTLEKASAHLASVQPESEVTVWLPACDAVVSSPIIWRYSSPDFMTHIRGQGSTQTRLNGNGLGNDLLKIMPTKRGEPSNLRFVGFRVSNSLNGIVISGDRNNEPSGWVGNIELRGIYIDRIGTKYAQGEYGAGAVRMVNARDCLIHKNQMHYLENQGSKLASMHALYVAHHSCDNIVEDNKISWCSGDPLRTRDLSNRNIMRLNTLIRSGASAVYSDWFCTGSSCTKPGGECPSWGNEVRDNIASWAGYNGANVSLFQLHGDANHCGATPLTRLRTSDNIRT